jgi:hypothetical protein
LVEESAVINFTRDRSAELSEEAHFALFFSALGGTGDVAGRTWLEIYSLPSR